MNYHRLNKSALLCAVSMVAISPAAMAQDQGASEKITVTGSGGAVITAGGTGAEVTTGTAINDRPPPTGLRWIRTRHSIARTNAN